MTGLDIARSLDPTALPETHYSVLGIEPTAAPEQVQDAYEQSIEEIRAESLAAYSLIASEEVERQLQRVSCAYMKLINPNTRNEYDQELLTKAANTPEPTPTEVDPEMPPREPEPDDARGWRGRVAEWSEDFTRPCAAVVNRHGLPPEGRRGL